MCNELHYVQLRRGGATVERQGGDKVKEQYHTAPRFKVEEWRQRVVWEGLNLYYKVETGTFSSDFQPYARRGGSRTVTL